MVLDLQGEYSSRWAAVSWIAAKISCSVQTLNEWLKKTEVDDGSPPVWQRKNLCRCSPIGGGNTQCYL